MPSLKRYLRLPLQEQWLLVESALLLTAAVVAVNVVPFSRLQWWIRREHPLQARGKFSRQQICWAMATATRVIPFTRCLAEALAMQCLMRHFGYEPVMRIGVCKRENGEFAAHAWIEHEGQVIMGADHQALDQYQRLPVF